MSPTSAQDRELQPLGKQVTLMLFELNARIRAHLEAVAGSLGLTPMQAKALHHLDEPCPMGDVAEQLMCDASNVTGIIDRLEERGLVTRELDPSDRRRRLLVRTDEGARVREQMHERLVAAHPITTGLSEEQLRQLRDLLQTALDAAN